MAETVRVTLDVDPRAAAVLKDPAKRAMVGQLISRMLEPASVNSLLATMGEISAEARRRGLTDEILEEELAAHKAEGLARPAGD